MREKYPEFNETWDFVYKQNLQIYKNEKLFNKYPEVFNDKGYPIQQNANPNIEGLLKLSDEKLDELASDIKNIDDEYLIYKFKCNILMYMDECPIYKSDDLYLYVYKVCEIFNALNNREIELRKEIMERFKKEKECEKDER